jgi:hypothetical protein
VRHEPRARDGRVEVDRNEGIVVVAPVDVGPLEHTREDGGRRFRLVFDGLRELYEKARRPIGEGLEAWHYRPGASDRLLDASGRLRRPAWWASY